MKCSFCQNELKPGTGKMFAKKDGKLLFFCSSKCENNLLKLGRKPRLTAWTESFRVEKAAAKKAAEK